MIRQHFHRTKQIFVSKILGMAAVFLLHVYIARIADDETYGMFIHISSLVNLTVVLSLLGMDKSIVRIAAIQSMERLKRVFAVIALLMVILSLSAVIVATMLSGYEEYFTAILLIAFTMIITEVLYGYLIGIGRSAIAEIVRNLVRSGFLFIGVGVFYIIYNEIVLSKLLLATIITNIIVISAYYYLTREKRDIKKNMVTYVDIKSYMSLAFPLYLAGIAQVVISQGAIAISGLYLPPEEVAYFATAARVGSLVSLILLASNAAIASEVAFAYRDGQTMIVRRLVRDETRKASLLALFLLAILVFFGNLILSIFGENYIMAYGAMLILGVAHLANVVTGPVTLLFSLSGKQKVLSLISILSAINLVVLSFILIPHYGIYGAGISVSLVMILANGIMWYLIWIRNILGIK